MPEDFVASTQYSDLKGTVEADGHEGSPLGDFAELTDMPEEYIPVGLGFNGVYVEDGAIGFTIIAVREDEGGKNLEEWRRYSATNGKLPVYRFEGQIKLTQLPRMFKRLNIKMVGKYLEALNIEVQDEVIPA